MICLWSVGTMSLAKSRLVSLFSMGSLRMYVHVATFLLDDWIWIIVALVTYPVLLHFLGSGCSLQRFEIAGILAFRLQIPKLININGDHVLIWEPYTWFALFTYYIKNLMVHG